MDEKEYRKRYIKLRLLKSIQDHLKNDSEESMLYPVKVPNDMLFQLLRSKGPDSVDKLMQGIFRRGLSQWCEDLYKNEFRTEKNLEAFIKLVKERNKESR